MNQIVTIATSIFIMSLILAKYVILQNNGWESFLGATNCDLPKPGRNFSILTLGKEFADLLNPEKWRECDFQNCFATNDANYFGENNQDLFDAVIVDRKYYDTAEHATKLMQLKRSPNQLYIMKTLEAPWHRGWLMIDQTHLYPYFFNVTWAIIEDANITDSYGPIFRSKNIEFHDPSFHPKGSSLNEFNVEKEIKTRLALWVVSHCKTTIKREDYVKELQKYMEVDVFGQCSGQALKCPEIGGDEKGDQVKCLLEVAKQYKFYLAFENSRCDNYWTEKLSHLNYLPVVPIVMGGMNYSYIMPKESYINVDDFESPQKLAKYLRFLDANWDEYLKFFKWRKDYLLYRRQSHCALCQMLNDPWKPHFSYENITRFFYFRSDGTPRCHDEGYTY